MKYLNLGCGYKYSTGKEWLNADMLPVGEAVIRCNFLNGIPFENETFELVYHSHILEHFSRPDGERFIAECFRILKPGGIIRIALPDLEVIAKEYLKNLERGLQQVPGADKDYDWIMLEMYDQTVRNQSGGEMLTYLKADTIPNADYVFNRIGKGAKAYHTTAPNRSLMDKLKIFQKKPSLLFSKLRDMYFKMVMPGSKYKLYRIGSFRKGGEIHQWMYDRYSLGRLLQQVGFTEIMVRKADTSYIPGWSSYQLDDTTETASLFIEGVKPLQHKPVSA